MGQLTRRQFLRSASGVLAAAGLSGCRTGAGEIVPPSGRRVVVVVFDGVNFHAGGYVPKPEHCN